MNWLFTFLFFAFIFPFYYFLGDCLLEFTGFKKNNVKRYVLGFLTSYFISFCVAFPSQFFHISWILYFTLQIFIYLVVAVFLGYKYKFAIKKAIKEMYNKEKLLLIIKENTKNNWVIYIFILVFTAFSMASQLSFYQMNYDDSYYIGKIVNQVGANMLSMEDYYNGMLISSNLDLARIVNTYEVSYGFWSYLFHIDIPFFCRVTMIVHNYLFTALLIKEVASLFVDRKYSQYAILPFFVLLISQGYLMEGVRGIQIRSYDMWQFQTAMFYGGSVVRVMSIPILIIFSYDLIEKITFKKISIIALISVSFVSFSTIYIQIFILFALIILLVKLIYNFYLSLVNKERNKILIYGGFIIIYILLVVFFKYSINYICKDSESYISSMNGYIEFSNHYAGYDILMKYGFVCIILCLLFAKSAQLKMVFLFLLLFYGLFRTSYFNEIINLSSFNMFFVSLRTISSLQYMILLSLGILFVYFYLLLIKNRFVINLFSVSLIVFIIFFIQSHYDKIKSYQYLGSGMIKEGYDFNRLLDINTDMMPDIYTNIGEYFNELDYGNYTLLGPSEFEYNHIKMYTQGFIISSNRIELCTYNGCDNLTGEEYNKINEFYKNNLSFYEIEDILNEHKIMFILVFNEEHKVILEKQGYTLVYNDKDLYNNQYYLFQIEE